MRPADIATKLISSFVGVAGGAPFWAHDLAGDLRDCVTIHQCEQVLDLFRRRAALHNNRHAQARAACVARLLRWIERRVEQEAAGT